MQDLNALRDELRYCLDHGTFGQRTGLALQWALDVVNDELNQCDGCRANAPLTERGNHAMPAGGFMGCTKDRYMQSETTDADQDREQG